MTENKAAGIEASAIGLLKEAVSLDTARRFTEALVCYREGIQLLMDVLKGKTNFFIVKFGPKLTKEDCLARIFCFNFVSVVNLAPLGAPYFLCNVCNKFFSF